MATCRECDSEVDTLKTVQVGGKNKKVCEDCAERLEQEQAVAEESEALEKGMAEKSAENVVRQMMGFKGKR